MFSRSLLRYCQPTCARVVALCALLLVAALAMTKAGATGPIRDPQSAIRNLTFEDRVAA